LYGVTLNINNRDDKVNTILVAHSSKSFEKEDVKPEIKCVIYPNPVEGILHITGLEGFYSIKIVDTVGQVVTFIKETSSELELDMSDKPAGMYLIKIESQGKSITRKLIKK
jgi:hypothetical protein